MTESETLKFPINLTQISW